MSVIILKNVKKLSILFTVKKILRPFFWRKSIWKRYKNAFNIKEWRGLFLVVYDNMSYILLYNKNFFRYKMYGFLNGYLMIWYQSHRRKTCHNWKITNANKNILKNLHWILKKYWKQWIIFSNKNKFQNWLKDKKYTLWLYAKKNCIIIWLIRKMEFLLILYSFIFDLYLYFIIYIRCCFNFRTYFKL